MDVGRFFATAAQGIVLLRVIVLLLGPAIGSVYLLLRTRALYGGFGPKIYSGRKTDYISIVFLVFIGGLLILVVSSTQDLPGLVAGALLYIGAFVAWSNALVRGLTCGIYERGLIHDTVICVWDEIETLYVTEDGIRFVHNYKGAVDFAISSEQKNRIIAKVEQISGLYSRPFTPRPSQSTTA